MNNLIATVAVEKTFFSTDSDFDYIIPVSLINNVKIGSMVKVPCLLYTSDAADE